jgi:hypothetical protein
MRTIWVVCLPFCSLVLSLPLQADCLKDHRTSKASGVLVAEFKISGTRTLSSDELSSIRGDLLSSCFDDNSEELEGGILASFQNRGYYLASLKNFSIKTTDPLTVPKPAVLEAEVVEGPRCMFGEIQFTGNHAFPQETLLAELPLKKNDVFQREKVGAGLEKVRSIYLANGYTEIVMEVDSRIEGDRVSLLVNVVEGSQFHMGKLQVFAKSEQSNKLRGTWDLAEGAVFDSSYLEKYINENRAMFPPNFTRDFAQVVRNCRELTVEVRLPIDQLDPRSQVPPKDIDCESEDARIRSMLTR